MDEGLVVGLPVGDFVLLLCHGTACVIRMMCDLILLLSKSSIYSTTRPVGRKNHIPESYARNLPQGTDIVQKVCLMALIMIRPRYLIIPPSSLTTTLKLTVALSPAFTRERQMKPFSSCLFVPPGEGYRSRSF